MYNTLADGPTADDALLKSAATRVHGVVGQQVHAGVVLVGETGLLIWRELVESDGREITKA